MDRLAREGRCGRLITVPEGFPPGSEIANLSLLGYDVSKQFEGRGSLEAASMGIDVSEGYMAARCNLICIQDAKIKNHSAGHISTSEAGELIDFLNKELGSEDLVFHTGVSYRHLLLLKGGNKELIVLRLTMYRVGPLPKCCPGPCIPGQNKQPVYFAN